MIRTTLCLTAMIPSCVCACVLNIAYSILPSPPYYLGEGSTVPENPGISVELVTMAAQNIGCGVRWQRAPQKRLQRMLEDGDIDATLALSFNKERAVQYAYPMKDDHPDASRSIATLTYYFYVQKESSLRWDGRRFNRSPAGVGANAGFSIVSDLEQLGIKVDEAPGELNNLKKLQSNRIEAYAAQDLRVDPWLAQSEFSGIEKLVPAIARKDYFLAFSRTYFTRSPGIANRLWKQIAELNKSQSKRLHEKYSRL